MPTTRQTPSGTMLDDGYQSKWTFAADPDVSLWEKTIKGPGQDGRDPIDTTTMWNETTVSKAARQLIDITDAKLVCAYDPKVWDQLLLLLNVNNLMTQWLPDGSKIDMWGFLRTAEPSELQEGEQPTIECNITITNRNASNVETPPVHYPAGSS